MADLLLVHDDRRIVDLVAFFLRQRGHVVRVATSFVAARQAIAARAPDLMLSDVDLGLERGEEELLRLAADGVLAPTLIVSGYLDADLEQRLLAIDGVLGTLRKPFGLSDLEARINDALASTAAARASHLAVPEDDDGWIEVRSAEAGS